MKRLWKLTSPDARVTVRAADRKEALSIAATRHAMTDVRSASLVEDVPSMRVRAIEAFDRLAMVVPS